MLERERKLHRAGVQHRHFGTPALGLPQGQGQHGGLVHRVRARHHDEIALFQFPHGQGDVAVQPGDGAPDFPAQGRVQEKMRAFPPLAPAQPAEGLHGLKAAPGGTPGRHGPLTMLSRDLPQPLGRGLHPLGQGHLPALHLSPPWAARGGWHKQSRSAPGRR